MSQKKNTDKEETVEISNFKRYIFYIFLFLIPFLFFIVLELSLTIFNYKENLDLFISAPDDLSHYMMCNKHVGRRYFPKEHLYWRSDFFLKEKPENCYRIFVLGGSTAIGFPYGDNLSFSRILQHQLADTFPDKYIEVVNTAMSAINTYTLLDFMDEIIENEADALLIYTGHNEFYGILGVASTQSLGKIRWIIKLYLKLNHFKTLILLKNITLQIRKMVNDDASAKPSSTLMGGMVANQKIFYGDEIYRAGKEQFEKNLQDIYKIAKENNIQVLISELVSNIRDQKPFISEKRDHIPAADKIFIQAKILDQQQKYIEAQKKYYHAKDLDLLRFRAPEEFNDIIYQIADKFNMPIVPMKKYFCEASYHNLIGDNLMTDHLHPNINGYFLMADAFFNTMRANRFVSARWDSGNVKSIDFYKKNLGITALDTAFAKLSIRYLKGGWPFQKKSKRNLSLSNYTPSTEVEAFTLKKCFIEKKNLLTCRIELAEYYQKRKEYMKAFREYKALYHTILQETQFYNNAAKMLLKMHNYNGALQVLKKSLQFHETAFACKWIGQIYLINMKFKEGIAYLEKSRSMDPGDEQVLYNLSKAYIQIGKYKEAYEIIDHLKNENPFSPYVKKLEEIKPIITK